jgi:hypothetical protein
VEIVRAGLELSPLLKKDTRCILFLNPASPGSFPAWQSADFWFGLQAYDAALAATLKTLADTKAAK